MLCISDDIRDYTYINIFKWRIINVLRLILFEVALMKALCICAKCVNSSEGKRFIWSNVYWSLGVHFVQDGSEYYSPLSRTRGSGCTRTATIEHSIKIGSWFHVLYTDEGSGFLPLYRNDFSDKISNILNE